MGIQITPLIGPRSDFPGPVSVLVEVDQSRILFDCGCVDRPLEPWAAPGHDPDELDSHDHRLRRYLDTVSALAPSLDVLVLSHPLLAYVGLLPLLRAKYGLRCPIYATLPTKEMGRWAVEEWIRQRVVEEPLGEPPLPPDAEVVTSDHDIFRQAAQVSLEQVQEAFDSVVAVRYLQPIQLSGSLRSLVLTARRSGHTLGGSLWSLGSSVHNIAASSASTMLYCPVFNHVRERHLDSAELLAQAEGGMRLGDGISQPGVLLIGGDRVDRKSLKRRDRDALFIDSIMKTLHSSRSVLIPIDASARIFELIVLLEQHWMFARLEQFPICLVSKTGKEVVSYLRSLTEWMSGSTFASEGYNTSTRDRDGGLLRFRHLIIYDNIEMLNASWPKETPKLVLATPLSLSHGFSRKLFLDFATVPGNLILLTHEERPSTLSNWLANLFETRKPNGASRGVGEACEAVVLNDNVTIQMNSKVELVGEELENFVAAAKRAEERQSKQEAILARSRRMLENQEDSDSDSSDDEDDITKSMGNTSLSRAVDDAVQIAEPDGHVKARLHPLGLTRGAWDEFVDDGVVDAMSFDIYVRAPYARASGTRSLSQRFKLFPFIERRRKVDAYGEVIDVEGWLKRGDTAVEASKEKSKSGQASVPSITGVVETPTKYVSEQVTIRMVCHLLVLDLEGKCDARALKTLIPQINPKRLILLTGPESALNTFIQSLQEISTMTKQINMPLTGERCEISEDVRSYVVRLGDSLLAEMSLSKVEGFEVTHVSGQLRLDVSSSTLTIHPTTLTTTTDTDDDRLLKDRGINEVKKAEGSSFNHLPLRIAPPLVGDLKLTTLKTKLGTMGIPATFVGDGILVCGPPSGSATSSAIGGVVAVKKMGKGNLHIDGPAGVTFSMVRRVVQNMHAGA